jgi:hypothetical protein
VAVPASPRAVECPEAARIPADEYEHRSCHGLSLTSMFAGSQRLLLGWAQGGSLERPRYVASPHPFTVFLSLSFH